MAQNAVDIFYTNVQIYAYSLVVYIHASCNKNKFYKDVTPITYHSIGDKHVVMG